MRLNFLRDIQRLGSSLLLGLCCFACLNLIALPAAHAQSPQANAEAAYAAIVEELWEDEQAEFQRFYSKLTPEGVAVFSRVIMRMDEGQRGTLALKLARSPTETSNSFLALYDGFAPDEFSGATARLRQQGYEKWDILLAALAVDGPDAVRLEFDEAQTARCVGVPYRDEFGNLPEDYEPPEGANLCSEEMTRFRNTYFDTTRALTRGYVLGANEALYQAQFMLFGPSTEAYKTDDARLQQQEQYGRPLEDWEINHTCGAVYLGDRFVLTAAHCVVTSLSNERFFAGRRVRLGTHSITGMDNIIPIRTVVTHAGYDPRTLKNDIALIQLEHAPRSSRVTEVILPSSPDYVPEPNNLLMSGWGYMKPTESTDNPRALDGEFQAKAAETLQGGRIQVFSVDVCKNNRVFRRNRIRIQPGQLCAGSRVGVDSCRGDSGGPVVETRSNTLVGLVSGGKGCGLFNTPSVYVDIAYYLDWIERAKRLALRSAAQTRRTAP